MLESPTYVSLFYSVMHKIKIRLDDMLAPYGITNQQARLLGFVYAAAKDGGEICQKDVELWMDLKASSVTSLIQGLEKNGFLVRYSGAKDGRMKMLRLTEKGIAQQGTFQKIFEEGEKSIVEGMTEEQKKMLLELMGTVLHNLKEHRYPH